MFVLFHARSPAAPMTAFPFVTLSILAPLKASSASSTSDTHDATSQDGLAGYKVEGKSRGVSV